MVGFASQVAMEQASPRAQWMMLADADKKILCANEAVNKTGFWVEDTRVQGQEREWHDSQAFRILEPPECITDFPIPYESLATTRIAVFGDSIGRFIFYSLANQVLSPSFGFPQTKFHKDIHAMDTMSFYWAPFATDLVQYSNNMTQYDMVVVSNGLWDKLHNRNVTVYEETLSSLFTSPLLKPKLLILVEMTSTVDGNLFGEEKRTYLAQQTAQEWRDAAYRAFARYPGRRVHLPTDPVTKHRIARDGVHYNMATYQAIVHLMLRVVNQYY